MPQLYTSFSSFPKEWVLQIKNYVHVLDKRGDSQDSRRAGVILFEAQQSHDNKFSLCLIKIKIALVKYIISYST